jgi:polyisoprenoid-binding protein YceI
MVKSLYTIALFAAFAVAPSGHAQHWNLPADLSPDTMEIGFKIDTTWHTVHGAVKGISGRASLPSPKDPRTISATLTLPVASLDTGSESRDEEMRECMEIENYPSISVEVPEIRPSCEERALTAEPACPYSTKGSITIRNVTLPSAITGTIHRNAQGEIVVDGVTQINWAQFGVKDPSILIARVNEVVSISFRITLPAKRKAV